MREFRVWAPFADHVEIDILGTRKPLQKNQDGWWAIELGEVVHGTKYGYFVDGAGPFPDPRSSFQPDGVHGPSSVVVGKRTFFSKKRRRYLFSVNLHLSKEE